MKRRQFLMGTAAAGVAATAAGLWKFTGAAIPATGAISSPDLKKLIPPVDRKIPVAVTISEGVQVIDFAGPWEVFQDVMVMEGKHEEGMEHRMPFDLYTVSEKIETIEATGGLKIIPNYTFANAPSPKIVIIPAQSGSPALLEWLKKVTASPDSDVVMSVCTGAFQLAKAGLLSGQPATTHHQFSARLKELYPNIDVKTGVRFVEGQKISTAGGLSSGIDLALRVVDRYYGRTIAQNTAEFMEYQGKGWMV